MDITRTPGEGCVRVVLRGRLDAAWSASVQDALSDCVRAGQHQIELDLSQVAFISSAGIRVLLITFRQLNAIQGRLAIVEASDEVREVIELSGLRALLGQPAAAAAPSAEEPALRRLDTVSARYEIQTLDAGARIAVRAIGDPAALLERGVLAGVSRVSFPASRLAVGVGAFGGPAEACGERLGELLALAGAAVTLPTSGEGRPDWVLCEERLVPEAHVAYGLVGEGAFAWQARFDATPAGPLPLDALVAAALAIAAADAVAIAVIAEAAQFVGAALRRSPLGQSAGIYGFPAIREQLDFTAEPAFPASLGVIAGFAARHPAAAVAAHLRPLDRDASIAAHLHAAVFPYRPLQRGALPLAPAVRELFESQSLLGLLHLLHDWRPNTGAGQTMLQRGALWCAPLSVADGAAA
ncbi:MAG: STAS domain-containing protein [bacterium]